MSTEEPEPQAPSRSVPCPSSSFPSEVLLLHHPGAQQRLVELHQTEKIRETTDKQSSHPNKFESGRLTGFGGSCVVGFLVVWDLVDIHISRGKGGLSRFIIHSVSTRESVGTRKYGKNIYPEATGTSILILGKVFRAFEGLILGCLVTFSANSGVGDRACF